MTLADAFNPVLARLRSRLAQSPLPRFWRWWSGELLSFLPQRWREALAVEDACIVLRPDGEGVEVLAERGGVAAPLLRLPQEQRDRWPQLLDDGLGDGRRELRRVLLLPASGLLRRALQLPAAALENLPAVLRFELDRQTPFKAEQVYFDSRVLRQDAGGKQIQVELVVAPRALMDTALDRLGALASGLAAVDAVDASGRRVGANLLPLERRASPPRTQPMIQAGLVLASIVLVMSGLGQVVANRQSAVEQMQAEVEAQRELARSATALRKQLEDAAAAANFLAVQKQTQASMVLLLERLTRRLPDDTFLERLSVSGGQISLTGFSGQATRLVATLQEDPDLRDVALNGSIQPDPRVGRDRFTITAGYGPTAGTKP